KRRRTLLVQPLVREDRARLRARATRPAAVQRQTQVRIRAVLEQQLDVLQVIHVRLARRIVPALDVAVVRRNVQRVPAVLVRNVRIRPLLEQILPEPVVPVLRRRQQRRPPELARLINVRTRLQQQLHRLQIPFSRRKNQRRQTARVLRLLPPTAERELALIVAGLGVRIRLGRRARLGGGSGRNGGRRRGRLEARGQRAD